MRLSTENCSFFSLHRASKMHLFSPCACAPLSTICKCAALVLILIVWFKWVCVSVCAGCPITAPLWLQYTSYLYSFCMQLALMLARSAHEIQKKSPGRFLVKQLLKLQSRRSGSVQIMQNVVCHVGESFEQNLVELMVRGLSDVDMSKLCMHRYLSLHSLLEKVCSSLQY